MENFKYACTESLYACHGARPSMHEPPKRGVQGGIPPLSKQLNLSKSVL